MPPRRCLVHIRIDSIAAPSSNGKYFSRKGVQRELSGIVSVLFDVCALRPTKCLIVRACGVRTSHRARVWACFCRAGDVGFILQQLFFTMSWTLSGCAILGVTNLCGDEETCIPGPEGYTCGKISRTRNALKIIAAPEKRVPWYGPSSTGYFCLGVELRVRNLFYSPLG